MASIKPVPEEEATGKVKDISEEIKSQWGIDFVPNLYKAMAPKPDYLEANWSKVKTVMVTPGKKRDIATDWIQSHIFLCYHTISIHGILLLASTDRCTWAKQMPIPDPRREW